MTTTLPYLRLRAWVAPERGSLPPDGLPAPLLRRLLGKALVDRFCAFGETLCEPRSGPARPAREHCRLAEACGYGVLFAAASTGRPPYALHVPAVKGRSDGAMAVEIALLSSGWELYAWTLQALAAALGRGVGAERRRWRVVRVARLRGDRREESLCRGDLSDLAADLVPDSLPPVEATRAAREAPEARVEVRLVSPARLVLDGRLVPGRAPVPFRLLVERILGRLDDLYGDAFAAALPAEARERLLARASEVALEVGETRWVEVEDYSARSKSELLLGGKVGRLVYGEGAAAFLPLLASGEVAGVGKNTASGNGRIEAALLRARGG